MYGIRIRFAKEFINLQGGMILPKQQLKPGIILSIVSTVNELIGIRMGDLFLEIYGVLVNAGLYNIQAQVEFYKKGLSN